LKTKALNDALAGVKVSTTQPSKPSEPSEPSKPLEVVQESSKSPAPRPSNTNSSMASFNQQFKNEMAKQQQQNKETNDLIRSEMLLQGINPNSSTSMPSSAAVLSKANTSNVASSNAAASNAAASNNSIVASSEPAKPKFKSLEQHAEEAGMKPYVAPVVPVEPVKTTSVGPEKVGTEIQKSQNTYYKKMEKDPIVARARAKIEEAKKAKENQKRKEQEEALASRKAVLEAEAKEKAAQKQLSKPFNPSSLEGAPNISKKISVMPEPKSAPLPPPEPKFSSNPSKMTKGMEQFMKREQQKQKAVKNAKQKKLEQIKLKIAMGQPLTANEKAIYRSQGGTRKKTKQSRKKIQTRKRSIQRSKRSTRTRK
jgi:hypothetical protein